MTIHYRLPFKPVLLATLITLTGCGTKGPLVQRVPPSNLPPVAEKKAAPPPAPAQDADKAASSTADPAAASQEKNSER